MVFILHAMSAKICVKVQNYDYSKTACINKLTIEISDEIFKFLPFFRTYKSDTNT